MSRRLRPGPAILIGFLILLVLPTSAGAKPASTPVGNDVSWPQCGSRLPSGQAFGTVGVNDGTANTTNPCFATELAWAQASTGATSQPKAALYVNTANPELAGSWWPTNNTYGGVTVTNPYGQCGGGDDAACAFMYGYAKAYDDVNSRGVPNPAGFVWWLDVETSNSWSSNTYWNTADLEGMVTYFKAVGVAGVGIYSTSYQWGVIAGNGIAQSPGDPAGMATAPEWVPGASRLSGAQANCKLAPFMTGGKITVTQYGNSSLDYDYACPAS